MDEIINYVMNTPGNTNPNILRGMLDEISSSRGGGDVLILHEDPNTHNLDRTAAEIYEASAQMPVIIIYSPSNGPMGVSAVVNGLLANAAHYTIEESTEPIEVIEGEETEIPEYAFSVGGNYATYTAQTGSDYPHNIDYSDSDDPPRE